MGHLINPSPFFGFGEQNGITFELAANKGRGSSDGDDVTHTNTSVKSGGTLNLKSGGDTNIKGATASGETVKFNVGGDLNIESLQDTSTYTSKQSSANVGLSVCVPPFCVGNSSVSGGVSQQHMHSEYASVSEQSGIKAGNGGFQVEVKGNTDLVGAIIASTDKAVADGKNTLSTGTLTTSDVKNKAEYDASSINLSGGYGVDLGKGGSGGNTANRGGPVNNVKEGANASTPIVLFASGNSSSTTHSGISGAAVTITNETRQQALTGQTAEQAIAAINTDVSSDRDGTNKLKPIFDVQEIDANFEIVGKFVQNVSQFIENRAKEADDKKKQADRELLASRDPNLSKDKQDLHRAKYDELKQQIKDIGVNWGPGGTYRQIATALVAGVSGGVTGSSAQFAQNMVVNYVQQQGSAYIGQLVLKGLKEGSPVHAGLHAILGCAGAAASNQSCSAGALGGAASSVLTALFADPNPDETAEDRETKRNLLTTLVAGIAAVSNPNGAATATNAAIANVDNNWLATQQEVQRDKEIAAEPNFLKKMQIYGEWELTSVRQDGLTGIGIVDGFKDGMAEAGLGGLVGAAEFMRHPKEGLDAMIEFVSSTEGMTILGEELSKSFQVQLKEMNTALEVGGDANAVNLGRQMGLAIAMVVGAVAGGGSSAARSAAILSRMGIDVASQAVKKISSSVDVDKIKNQLNKLQGLNKVEKPDPLDPRVIEINATRDGDGFGMSLQRDFAPGKDHRAENINAGQVTDRDGLPRVDDLKTANDNLLTDQSGGVRPPYWGTQRPAWKEGTIVTDRVVDKPRTMTMTIDQKQYTQMLEAAASGKNPSPALGGWATDTPINSVADVRNKLAVSEEFKKGQLFQIEFTVKPGVGIREGTVGDMWDAMNNVRLPGGGHQVNFMDKTPRTNPELYEVNMNSIRALQ